MNAGDAVLLPDGISAHLYVVLAVLEDGSLVMCHFTKLRPHSDVTCIIQPGEHSFVTEVTSVRYDQAYHCCGDGVAAFERLIMRRFEPLSEALFTRVRRGALDSPQTPDKVKALLR